MCASFAKRRREHNGSQKANVGRHAVKFNQPLKKLMKLSLNLCVLCAPARRQAGMW
jgi:hypothetical protein